jgi:hypothetical protein
VIRDVEYLDLSNLTAADPERAKYSIVNDLLILGGFFVGFVRRTHDDKLF